MQNANDLLIDPPTRFDNRRVLSKIDTLIGPYTGTIMNTLR